MSIRTSRSSPTAVRARVRSLCTLYQFSQDYLGVDPMYYWTDQQPAKRSRIVLPGSLARRFPPPLFQYRGLPHQEILWSVGLRGPCGYAELAGPPTTASGQINGAR